MKLVEINSRTPVFQNIATLMNMDNELGKLEVESSNLAVSLENYRTELQVNSPELKIIDMLSEEQIMNGAFSDKLVEALEKCKNINLTVSALKSLGFRTESYNFSELNTHITDAYTVLRKVAKECMEMADKEMLGESVDGSEVYLDMFRQGIRTSAMAFLSLPRYFKVHNIEVPITTTGDIDSDLVVSHHERFNEWVDNEVENVLLALFSEKTEAAYIAPIGLDKVLATIKSVSPEAADMATDFGAEEFTSKSIKKHEFIESVKKLDIEKRNQIVQAIHAFNNDNVGGVLQTATGPVPLPAAISIVDAFVGFMLYVGEVLTSMVGVLPNATVGEIMDQVDVESVKVYLDLVTEKLHKYENASEIACNMASLPIAHIPMFIFTNPTLKLTNTPALNHLTLNVTEVFDLLPKAVEEN